MKDWSRADKIAFGTLIITVLGVIGAWVVVPEFRKVFRLDSPEHPSETTERKIGPEGSPTPVERPVNPTKSAQASPTGKVEPQQSKRAHSNTLGSDRAVVDLETDPQLKGFWIDATVSINNERPLLIEFLRDSRVRGRTDAFAAPFLIPGYVWYKNGETIRLIIVSKTGNVNCKGVLKGDLIEGTETFPGVSQNSPWKLERVRTNSP
jgi:hypothetical protein